MEVVQVSLIFFDPRVERQNGLEQRQIADVVFDLCGKVREFSILGKALKPSLGLDENGCILLWQVLVQECVQVFAATLDIVKLLSRGSKMLVDAIRMRFDVRLDSLCGGQHQAELLLNGTEFLGQLDILLDELCDSGHSLAGESGKLGHVPSGACRGARQRVHGTGSCADIPVSGSKMREYQWVGSGRADS